MSKIAEEKSLKEYPLLVNKDFERLEVFDNHVFERQAYIEGYDQAMQDFLEKAEEFFYEQFNIHPHDCHVVQYVSDTALENMDDFIKQFKNYMQDEN